MHVRAAGGLADGVETALTEVRLQELDGLEMSAALPKPCRQARCGKRRVSRDSYLDKGIGNHETLSLPYRHVYLGGGCGAAEAAIPTPSG